MRSTTFTYFLILVIATALIGSETLFDRQFLNLAYGNILFGETSFDSTQNTVRPIAFVGDVMLARDVEQYMKRYGTGYPFGIFDQLPSYAHLIGNFESAVPKKHVPTPAHELRFSVPVEHLDALRAAGFTHLSLANNHSYDFGGAGYLSTLQSLRDHDMAPFGHPSELTGETVRTFEYDDTTIALIGFHTLEGEPPAEELSAVLQSAAKESDLQIAYIHWGEEYVLKHGKQQQRFAHKLIDSGVDLVIGHHPHVVQGVEEYRGKLIVYSLGNFIFDQYFSEEVGDGLIIELSVQENGYRLGFVPVTTAGSRIRPRLLTGYERDQFLTDLVARSGSSLAGDLHDGVLHLSHELAY